MRRGAAVFLLLCLLWIPVLALGAAGRVMCFEVLSPPDLAFFHQATWNAFHGHGLTQTALEFDDGSLTRSVHLSPVRLLWVPLYGLWQDPRLLVGVQGAVLASTGIPVLLLARGRGFSGPVAGLLAAVVGMHPLLLALGTTDLRPLTFMVPGVVWAAWGLDRGRALPVLAGAAWAAMAREEAGLVLLALLPWGVLRARASGSWRGVLGLGVGVLGALALPMLVWGRLGNIATNRDVPGTVDAILTGSRPLIRWSQEGWFGLRCLVAAAPALLAPELVLPGLLGWGWLVVFSELEPVAPHHGGMHYLAVVAPFVLAAVPVGLDRARLLWGGRTMPRIGLLLGGLGVAVVAGPELMDLGRWTLGAVGVPGAEARSVRALVAPVIHSEAGVLAHPRVAPMLSGRRLLRVQGHFQADIARVTAVVDEVEWAVLEAHAPPEGPLRDEWNRWRQGLKAACFEGMAEGAGLVRYRRVSPPSGCVP